MAKKTQSSAKVVALNPKPKAPIVTHVRNIHIKRLTPKYQAGIIPDPANLNRSFTLAAVIKDGEIKIGYSVCSEKDNFNKQIGRQIALSRATNVPLKVRKLPKNANIKTVCDILNKEAMKFPEKNSHLFDFEEGIKRAIANRSGK